MSRITINSNIASLNAQRRLALTTAELRSTFERLSSGLRITRARDDAAGLSISESLNVDARVFAQGIRNLNDGISLLNIAEGALSELSNILMRQRELAQQSANGTLSREQRLALTEEANSLTDEFNRIVETSDFNGLGLLDLSVGSLRIQSSYGTQGSISFDLGEELSRTVGDGSFRDPEDLGISGYDVEIFDLNSDGKLDMSYVDLGQKSLMIALGNGDGTFETPVSYAVASGDDYACAITVGDFNGDGIYDVAASGFEYPAYIGRVSVLIGNGDGTFQDAVSYNTAGGWSDSSIVNGDVDGDGDLDIVSVGNFSGYTDERLSVIFGNGDGTFGQVVSYWIGGGSGFSSMYLADLNGDNHLDIIGKDWGMQNAVVYFGTGGGAFSAVQPLISATSISSLQVGDVNLDGRMDLVVGRSASGGYLETYLGNGDGTFRAPASFTGDGYYSTLLDDVNGDGYLDLTGLDLDGVLNVYLGNGDGSFQQGISIAGNGFSGSISYGDFDNDGAEDIILDQGVFDMRYYRANSNNLTTIGYLNLSLREGALAAMEVIDSGLRRVNAELGAIGAAQSRIGTAISTLSQTGENYLQARTRIVDADVAEESAILIKNQILQQAGAAVLSQANLQPKLAIDLINSV